MAIQTRRQIVGAILFPGFELLDLFGPLELFGLADGHYELLMLGTAPGAVASAQGPKAHVDALLADAPPLDVLLLPGGIGTRSLVKSDEFMDAYRRAANGAGIVATVCTGSGVLAHSGLLDGRRATSNKQVFHFAQAMGPRVQWIRRARWVRDGRFYTSSGVSAGMDMTLAIIQDSHGRSVALETAQHAEYTWHEDADNDPFAA